MSDEAWNTGYGQCLGVRFPGDLIGDVNERGEPITGDSIVFLVNAHHETIPFTLPSRSERQEWGRLIDTAEPQAASTTHRGHTFYNLKGGSMVVLVLSLRGRKVGPRCNPVAAGTSLMSLDQRASAIAFHTGQDTWRRIKTHRERLYMMTDAWGVDVQYEDAAGVTQQIPEEVLGVLRSAIGRPARSGSIVAQRSRPQSGSSGRGDPGFFPAEITLEDGTSMEIRDRLPGTLPVGYHSLTHQETRPPRAFG